MASRRGPLTFLAELTVRYRWRVLACSLVVVFLAGLAASAVTDKLSAGGYAPATAESTRAEQFLSERFGAGAPDLVLVARAPGSVDAPDNAAAGRELTESLERADGVTSVTSYWSAQAPPLRSRDGDSALILAVLDGDEADATRISERLSPDVTGRQGPLSVQATGRGMVNLEDERLAIQDMKSAEVFAGPITAMILLLAFGSLVAVGLPLIIGAIGVVGTLALLVLLSEFLDVSVFALNLTTALGFGLAVDYSLFIVTRFREELGKGHDVPGAIGTTMRTVGRAVLFSAVTVVAALSALLVFPVDFLRSLAYTVMAVVVLAALAAVLVMPAVLAVLGTKLNRFDPLARLRRRWSRRHPDGRGTWHRIATAVMRRPILIGGVTTVLLVLLAVPFTHVKFGLFDERILPADSPPHAAATVIRSEFEPGELNPITVVLPNTGDVDGYAQRLAALPDVNRVDAATGSYADGQRVSPSGPASTRMTGSAGSWLTVISDADPNSSSAEQLVRDVRATPAPTEPLVGGPAATLVDTKETLTDRLPWAGLIIVVSMFVLLFLFTGSLLIPVKALVLNLLSLTATFGAMVYVFQDGNLQWLVGEFTVTGYVDMTAALLLFCLAFGLSMDYEVFLLSRIKEEYDLSGDNTHAVAWGLEHTGRLFTAAALIFASVMGALVTSGVSLVKLAGLGMALAVLMDATLIRGLLVPAFMRLLGRANWWAPAPLRRLHARIQPEPEERTVTASDRR
jgi:putative drug exporter of the RND superfamily